MSSPVKSLSWWAENSVFWNHHASSCQLSTWQTCLRPLRSPWTTHGVVFRELGNVIWPIYCHMWPHGARPHSGLSFRLRPCRLVWRGHLLWKHRAGLNRQCVKPAPNKSKSKPAGKHWPTGATLMFILNFSSLFWAFPFPASCICSCLWLLRSCAVNLSHWRLYFLPVSYAISTIWLSQETKWKAVSWKNTWRRWRNSFFFFPTDIFHGAGCSESRVRKACGPRDPSEKDLSLMVDRRYLMVWGWPGLSPGLSDWSHGGCRAREENALELPWPQTPISWTGSNISRIQKKLEETMKEFENISRHLKTLTLNTKKWTLDSVGLNQSTQETSTDFQ